MSGTTGPWNSPARTGSSWNAALEGKALRGVKNGLAREGLGTGTTCRSPL